MINFINLYLKKNNNFRFPPDPNGYLHFGHVFSIFLNKNLSKIKKGNFFLRFDNTNLINNFSYFYKNIKKDILWLNSKWNGKILFFQNKINIFYKYLIFFFKKKKCYYKKKKINNRFFLNYIKKLNVFECFLFKNNFYKKYNFIILVKKKIVYRKVIKKRHWNISSTYDFSQPLNDYLNYISISICTNEFINNSKFYHYIFKKKKIPIQIEFKKKNFKNVKISKKKLKLNKIYNLFYLRKIGFSPKILKIFSNIINISNKSIFIKKKILKIIIYYELNYLYKICFYFNNFFKIKNIKKNIIICNFYNFKNINFNLYLSNINIFFYFKKMYFKKFKKIFINKKKIYYYKKKMIIIIIIKIIKNKCLNTIIKNNHYYNYKKKLLFKKQIINNVN
ncbi:glutamate--tRNA ligase family protein [Candidatus Carsonella ruddii]|uniref:Glutaminyl-tRNA synthetase n=1 Tax=Candidatus Carsonella ruddii PC isolate NHV TaxID=1202540 RepID=J3YQP8_CARRU|nr:glutamate--tRNA ligase family protein [Candidatus Carsonella ruddii]AFP84298.1 glutaminyl-tRNA synthetase [Candidatus Carsonella ruddii PC isolate NHV]